MMSSCEEELQKNGAVPPIFSGTPCSQANQVHVPPPLKRIELPLLSQQRNVLGSGMPAMNGPPHQLQFYSATSDKHPSTVVQHKPVSSSSNAACKFDSNTLQHYHHQQQQGGLHPAFMHGLPNLPLVNTDLAFGTGHQHQKPFPKAVFNYNNPYQQGVNNATGSPSAMTSAARPKQLQVLHVPVPVQYYRPQSPSYSDISSIMLTSPLSPGSTISGSASNDPQHLRSFLLSRRNASLPPLSNANSVGNVSNPSVGGSTYDEAEHTSIPPTSLGSPFLDSTTDASSSTCTSISSRKRPLSGSPMSDLSEFGSIIRASPNSVIAFLGQNQSPGIFSLQPGQTGASGMGHLIGQNSSHLPMHPAHYMVKEQETLIEQNQSFSHGNMDMKITNRITFSERQPPLSPTAAKSEEMVLPSSDIGYHIPMDAAEAGPSEESRLVCQWKGCFLRLNSVVELVQHLEKVHIEKGTVENFVCLWNDCPRKLKPFNARYKLIIHMRIHSGEKPNKCPYAGCSKAFSRLENLKIHIRTHTGEKPYTCQYTGCTKSFSNSSDRSKHQKTHYEEKPYACTYPGCEKRYTDPSSLRKHARSHSQKKKPRKEGLTDLLHIQGLRHSESSGTKSKMKKEPQYPASSRPLPTQSHTDSSYSSPPDGSNPGFPLSNQQPDVYHTTSISPQYHHVMSPPNPTVTLQHPPTLSSSPTFSPLNTTSITSPQYTGPHGGSTSDGSPVNNTSGDIHTSIQPLSPPRVNVNPSSDTISSMHLPKYSDPSNFNPPHSYIQSYIAPPPTYEDSLQQNYIPQYSYSSNQIQGPSTIPPPELSHFN